MADYGPSDTSTTSLGVNQFPISEVYTPSGTQTPTTGGVLSALESGPASLDSSSPPKRSAPASMYVKDGNDVAQGSQADAAYTSGSGSIVSILKGIFSKLTGTLTIGGTVAVSNVPALQAVSQAASQPVSGTLQNAAAGTGNGTALAVAGMSSVVFTVSGTFSGTVTFQASEDGANYNNLTVTQQGTDLQGNTATGPGLFEASLSGQQSVIAAVTQITSGTITVTAHAQPNGGTARVVTANIATWNGLVPGNSNPVITQDVIRGLIAAGQGFTVSSGKVAPSVAGTFGTAIFNASTAKNALIYSIRVFASALLGGSLNLVSADPAFGTPLVAYNQKPGAGTSLMTLDGAAATPSVGFSAAGNTIETLSFVGGQTIEILTNGAVILLPAGASNGLVCYLNTSGTTQSYIMTYRYLEF